MEVEKINKIYMQFEAGTDASGKGINFLSGENEDISIFASIEIPKDKKVSEDYGYIGLKKAIIKNVSNDIAKMLVFQYDGQENHLHPDAEASENIKVEIE